jgi:REP element-mobilizing transposase RayT
MRLNDAGRMLRSVWEGLPGRFSGMELDAFVVMPNHIHGIIVTHGRGESRVRPYKPTHTTTTPQSPSKTIGSIVRGFKIAIRGKGKASIPPHASEE